MQCRFAGFFDEEALVGIAISQFLDLNQLESFGERDQCMKLKIRNLVFRNFSSHVLFLGNNMLSGQNAYVFAEHISKESALTVLNLAATALQERYKLEGFPIHLTSIKDFSKDEICDFKMPAFQNHYRFSTQPNMLLTFPANWQSELDYVHALTKKYRDQYKRARKKIEGIEKRKLNLAEIIQHEDAIHQLYLHVAKSAPFNTFYLPKNHFRVFKEQLGDNFLFYGYFANEKLIGFNTLVKNGNTLDTYFLGYDDGIQKEKMLYLNMLYDMIGYALKKQFSTIVFGRTALEIKSSVGAQPQPMFGLIRHRTGFINSQLHRIFPYLEPEIEWKERHPFKD